MFNSSLNSLSCILTAGNLTNNSSTQSVSDQQQNTIQDVVITKTSEVNKYVQNKILNNKKENKTTQVKNTKKYEQHNIKCKTCNQFNQFNQNQPKQQTIKSSK